MVKESNHENGKVFLCEICLLGYKDSMQAQRCEDYCDKFSSCSLEI